MPTLTTPYVGATIVVEHELNKFGSFANIAAQAAQAAHPLEEGTPWLWPTCRNNLIRERGWLLLTNASAKDSFNLSASWRSESLRFTTFGIIEENKWPVGSLALSIAAVSVIHSILQYLVSNRPCNIFVRVSALAIKWYNQAIRECQETVFDTI
jgi:hypothetical protein